MLHRPPTILLQNTAQIELDAELGEKGSRDGASSASASSDVVLTQLRENEGHLEREQVCMSNARKILGCICV